MTAEEIKAEARNAAEKALKAQVKNVKTIDVRMTTTHEQRRQANEAAKKLNPHVPVFADFEVLYSLPEIKDEIKILVSAGSQWQASDKALSEIAKRLKPEIARDPKKVVWVSTKKMT